MRKPGSVTAAIFSQANACGCRMGHPQCGDLGIFVDQSAKPVVASGAAAG